MVYVNWRRATCPISPPMFLGTPKELDAALDQIDRERARLRAEFDRDMAKLDADERELLGLKPEATELVD